MRLLTGYTLKEAHHAHMIAGEQDLSEARLQGGITTYMLLMLLRVHILPH
jgi:hypothetical protein